MGTQQKGWLSGHQGGCRLPCIHKLQNSAGGCLPAGIQITQWDRNGWKWTVWGVGEQIGWELWELTTRQYYR